MKRLISILVITVLLANLAGFYVYFYFRTIEIKKAMHAEVIRTSPELFQKISLSKVEYNLAKEGDDELEWNNIMYDVASIKFNGDSVEILALPDSIETNLLSFLSLLRQSGTSDSKTPPTVLFQFLSLTFTLTEQPANEVSPVVTSIHHNTLYQLIESDIWVTLISPPPKG